MVEVLCTYALFSYKTWWGVGVSYLSDSGCCVWLVSSAVCCSLLVSRYFVGLLRSRINKECCNLGYCYMMSWLITDVTVF
jgi:hypothetical protein